MLTLITKITQGALVLSLFLGLNYLINQEITVGKDLDGREALFAMENCVYMASPRSSGANSPDCQ